MKTIKSSILVLFLVFCWVSSPAQIMLQNQYWNGELVTTKVENHYKVATMNDLDKVIQETLNGIRFPSEYDKRMFVSYLRTMNNWQMYSYMTPDAVASNFIDDVNWWLDRRYPR